MQLARVSTLAMLCVLGGVCSAADQPAKLTCEQIFSVAQTAVRYRDQGYSLDQVLKGLKDVEGEGKFTAVELETLRRTVTLAYLGNATPEEIALECVRVLGTKKP